MRSLNVTLDFKHMTNKAFELLYSNGLNPELYFNAEMVEKPNSAFMQKLKAALKLKGFKPTFHMPYVATDVGSKDAGKAMASINRSLCALNAAHEVNAEILIFHPGYGNIGCDKEFDEWLIRAAGNLDKMLLQANRLGLKIAFENIYDSHPWFLKKLLDSFSPKFAQTAKICFDAGHFNLFGKIEMKNWLEALEEKIIICHLHDNDKSGDQHRAMGDGCTNFAPLACWYNNLPMANRPVLTFECTSEADVLKSKDFLDSLLGNN